MKMDPKVENDQEFQYFIHELVFFFFFLRSFKATVNECYSLGDIILRMWILYWKQPEGHRPGLPTEV